jgi:hypothetical protein
MLASVCLSSDVCQGRSLGPAAVFQMWPFTSWDITCSCRTQGPSAGAYAQYGDTSSIMSMVRSAVVTVVISSPLFLIVRRWASQVSFSTLNKTRKKV